MHRNYTQKAIFESICNPDVGFCQFDSIDCSKMALPHVVQKPKFHDQERLLTLHATCVKGNGKFPDDVYMYSDCLPHDSNTTVTIMYHTLMKEINRNDYKPLRKMYFQLDNTTRENKNKYVMAFLQWAVEIGMCKQVVIFFEPVGHTHDLVDQVLSRFSVWLNRHDARSYEELLDGLAHKALKPEPNVQTPDRSFDIHGWLEAYMCTLDRGLVPVRKYISFFNWPPEVAQSWEAKIDELK
eukprot:jgi/Tetstr1/444664/TSEL_032512.t1